MNDLKHRIDALCGELIAAPDGSEELKGTMDELRSALADYVAQHLRRWAAELRQKDVLLFKDESNRLVSSPTP
jgi:hypothetical protein